MVGPQTVNGWPGLKDPGPEAKEFMANGHRYVIAESISIDRWGEYLDLQVEVGLPRTFEQIQAEAVRGYELCNRMAQGQHHLADIAIILRDLATGSATVGAKQTEPALKLCTLFINRAGEDTRYVDQQDLDSKIEDWKKEGISMTYFFRFAFRSIPGFIAAYRLSTQDTSAGTEGNQNQSGSPDTSATKSDLPGTTLKASSNE